MVTASVTGCLWPDRPAASRPTELEPGDGSHNRIPSSYPPQQDRLVLIDHCLCPMSGGDVMPSRGRSASIAPKSVALSCRTSISWPALRRVRCFTATATATATASVVVGCKSAEEPVGRARQVGRVKPPVTVGFTSVACASLRHQAHSSQRSRRARDSTPTTERCQSEKLARAAMGVRGAAGAYAAKGT